MNISYPQAQYVEDIFLNDLEIFIQTHNSCFVELNHPRGDELLFSKHPG